MPVSEAKKKSNAKWDSANLDRLSIALPKGTKAQIKAAAESQGKTVNLFIKDAINDALARVTVKNESETAALTSGFKPLTEQEIEAQRAAQFEKPLARKKA